MNRLNTLTALCALLLSGFTLFAAESDLPVYRCGRFTGEITIDGKADEVAWSQADTVGDLAFSRTTLDELELRGDIDAFQFNKILFTYARRAVSTKLLWDEQALYVFFKAEMPKVWHYRSGRDVSGFYEENAFELMFDPNGDGQNYVEINASPAGDSSITDILRYLQTEGSNYDYNIDGLQYAVHVEGTRCNSIVMAECNQDTDEYWSMELKLPFAGMKGTHILAATDKEKENAFTALEGPPVLVREDVLNWDVLGSSLTDTETLVPGQMLESEMNAEDVEGIKSASTLTEDMKTALLNALNGLILNPLTFPSFSADITVSAEVETGDDGWNVYYKYPVLKNEPIKMDYTGTKPVLGYPLGDSATFIQQNATSRDTIFMTGCSVPDTIIERYHANIQRYQLPKLAKDRYDRLVGDSVFVVDTVTGTVSLAEELPVEDSVAIRWFNFFLAKEILFPGVIATYKEMFDTLTHEAVIAEDAAFPPNDGDEWNMNIYYVTSEPCSLQLYHYTWANAENIRGNEFHQHANDGILRFVDGVVDIEKPIQPMNISRPQMRVSALTRGGVVTVNYSLTRKAEAVSLRILNAAGALVWEGTLADRNSGTHTVSIPGNLGSGAFVLRLEADGNVLTRKAFLVK